MADPLPVVVRKSDFIREFGRVAPHRHRYEVFRDFTQSGANRVRLLTLAPMRFAWGIFYSRLDHPVQKIVMALLYVVVLCMVQLHTTIKLYTGENYDHDRQNL